MKDTAVAVKVYTIGVDVGGTFTDAACFSPKGRTYRAKVPSTPQDQSIGVKEAVRKIKDIVRREDGFVGRFTSLHHGTTVATNAILENKIIPAALIVTAGHKDVLSARRSQIPGGLAAWIGFMPPDPLIPLENTIQCRERIGADGEIVLPVDRSALKQDLESIRGKIKAVTISLLNSYVDGRHEKEVAGVVREVFGESVDIIMSHEVLPEAGEYERTVTAAANTVIRPEVSRYLDGLKKNLSQEIETTRLLKSDGGLTHPDWASMLPVNILMSGPAGGVRGVTSVISQATEYKNLITLDMGGTSTDVALIASADPSIRRETKVGNLTVRAPCIDVRTIGAGGGSLAIYQPLTSTLRVGPESSGARPGPACYKKGGTQATVTDANAVLGYLPQKLLGGDFELDIEAARTAVGNLAKTMNQTTIKTAEDIVNLANENMFGALRLVSVEQGYNPADFALVAFGGAGPLHANALGKLIGAWPVIVPVSPGILCAQGDATTKMGHEMSLAFIRLLADLTKEALIGEFMRLRKDCTAIMSKQLDTPDPVLSIKYQADVRYHGQQLDLTISLVDSDLEGSMKDISDKILTKFEKIHEQNFSYTMPGFKLEITRLGVVATDASPDIETPRIAHGEGGSPPDTAIIEKKIIIVDSVEHEATFWDRSAITRFGWKVQGPCVVVEMDSNTLIHPGYEAVVDLVGNLCISPSEKAKDTGFDENKTSESDTDSRADALRYLESNPTLPTLVQASLAAIRAEMDTLMLRCSMSPAVREQQDEFNVITNPRGQMLVGQFGSFVGSFLEVWADKVAAGDADEIREGDVFITNDVYEVRGPVSHLNDVIILLPIWFKHEIVGWAANFAHMSDMQGQVPGSMSINATSIYADGLQIPCMKLYDRGRYNRDIINLVARNCRQADWLRSDLSALLAACRTAAKRVEEMCDRFGKDVYLAATDVLLERNRVAIAKLIEEKMSDEPSTFTDFVDDDGHGNGPFALVCTLQKEAGKLIFDWNGTSPQAASSINFYLSETMFKMFVGYYLLAVYDPYTVVNDGFHDLLDIRIPLGSVLKPVRPAALSCRTHFLGRVMDVMQALFGQRDPAYLTAAGFSDSPHFFYSGFKSSGEWFQLYQIAFGGVPARPKGDGLDCHCLFPAIKSVPTELIEINYPVRLEVNEAVADSGGAGYYRGGNAQRTCYRFLSRGEFSLHDDRWYTRPWGAKGGKPGMRSRKTLHRTEKDGIISSIKLPSKCDHVTVNPGDLLEWVTWGGGGLGDPLQRPAEVVALEVRRKLVSVKGAKEHYGVIINESLDKTVDEAATQKLRATMTTIKLEELGDKEAVLYDRGGTLEEMVERCEAETGFRAPKPQWEEDPYGPHVGITYVQEWFTKMRKEKFAAWKL
ncbi:hydantoin utilization protein-like protein A [Pseudovirgaria hyperparasitica]|uniref:Hydantoin utilization protein-like protein A n=1 Tax=Pseudovirgaria hyperparasitica TaxID=470096 RepID=A0A6A6W3L9_9PEZI|nr:hydantoin utilization protein-like protein A [Pseudovirgaria hyperparasitica]KAF2757203.1 hydantoin utilization protein-like protein A [Pseudovirgaria hyperparasitica]